ncbi:MAG TPA: hypothetical protein VMZ71_03065, partial [Gemmataceae bacterium]|nr:hypothetical protein [Gemmataceae bacterium]
MRLVALVLFFALAPPARAADPTRLDLYGDPLPTGAVARLGTLERTHTNLRRFHFAPDGKTFHASAAGPARVQFDAATGKRTRVVRLPGLDGSWPWISADGSTALVEHPGRVYQLVEIVTGKVRVELPSWITFQNFLEPLSPNGRYFAAADKNHTTGVVQMLHIWDTHTGKTWELGSQNDGIVQAWFS